MARMFQAMLIVGIVHNALKVAFIIAHLHLQFINILCHELLTSVGVSFAALHEQGADPVVARISMAFKTPLKSGDEFISKLYMKKEGIKYVFYQDIFRKSDNKVVVKSSVETVCVVNGRLSDSQLFDNVFAPYLK